MFFLKIIFILLTAGLAMYGLITKDFRFQEIMFLSMVGMFILIGIEEWKKGKKSAANVYLILSALLISAVVVGLVSK